MQSVRSAGHVPRTFWRRRVDVVVQFTNVFLEIEVAAESLAAGGAGEGLLVVVRVHVERQVVDLVEGLVADGALVLLLPTVCQLVVLVIPFLMETFAAELADEGLVSCVDTHVRVERRAPVECLSALVTLMRLLLCVDNLVPAQSTGLTEAFSAHFTHEGPRARVHGHVSGQVIMCIEYLATHFTCKVLGLPVRVGTIDFAVRLVGALVRAQNVVFDYLVQLPGQVFLMRVLRCWQFVRGKFGAVTQQ